MRWLAYPFLLWAAILLQTTWPETAALGGARPDFALLLVVWFGLHEDRIRAGPAASGIGLVQDLFSVGPVGVHALAYLAVALLMSGRRRSASPPHPAVRMLAAGAVVFAFHLLEPAFTRLAAGDGPGLRIGAALWEGTFNAGVAGVLYPLLRRMGLGPRRHEGM